MSRYQSNIDSLSDTEKTLFFTLKGMLEGKIDFLEGSRTLSRHRFQANRIQEDLLFFTGIASETDEFPLGESQRSTWSKDALARLDREKEEFFASNESLIREQCNSILSKLLNVTDN